MHQVVFGGHGVGLNPFLQRQHGEPQLGRGQQWVQAAGPEQSWGSQRDGMMQNHVPWGQKGAINGEKGGE